MPTEVPQTLSPWGVLPSRAELLSAMVQSTSSQALKYDTSTLVLMRSLILQVYEILPVLLTTISPAEQDFIVLKFDAFFVG